MFHKFGVNKANIACGAVIASFFITAPVADGQSSVFEGSAHGFPVSVMLVAKNWRTAISRSGCKIIDFTSGSDMTSTGAVG